MERKYFKSLTDQERKQLKQNIFQRLKIKENEDSPAVFHWKRMMTIGIAASLLAVIGLLTFQKNDMPDNQKLFLASTKEGEVKQILLADSSVVILNPGSSLYSSTDFSEGKRDVYLTGSGFFKVKTLSDRRQFVVHANSLNVTVLGTQFNVNARSTLVEVVLTSGRVQVTKGTSDQHPEFMVPGEKLKLDASGNFFERTPIDITKYSAWTKGEWNFRNYSLDEICLLIKEYYGIKAIFENEKAKELRITAVIPVTTLDGLLKVIHETLLVDITENNGEIFIQ